MDGQENGLRSARIVKRHRRDLKGKKIGIMKQTIRRLGRRAGVERISYLSYEAPASTMHKRKYPQDASSLDCKVCFQKMEEKLTFSPKCGHAFCLVCWKGYVKAKIKEGSVRRIACMGDGCNEKLSEGDILNKILAAHGKGLLSGRYKKFKSANLADRNPAKRWCWTPDCNTVLDKKQLKCPTCKKKWSKKAAEEFQKQMEKIAHSLDLPITESLRRCKECDAFIIKKKGTCNKMMCRCGYRFCWSCGSKDAKCTCTSGRHMFVDNQARLTRKQHKANQSRAARRAARAAKTRN